MAAIVIRENAEVAAWIGFLKPGSPRLRRSKHRTPRPRQDPTHTRSATDEYVRIWSRWARCDAFLPVWHSTLGASRIWKFLPSSAWRGILR
jgi:hypothetical protein